MRCRSISRTSAFNRRAAVGRSRRAYCAIRFSPTAPRPATPARASWPIRRSKADSSISDDATIWLSRLSSDSSARCSGPTPMTTSSTTRSTPTPMTRSGLTPMTTSTPACSAPMPKAMAAHTPRSDRAGAQGTPMQQSGGGRAVATALCSGQTAGLTDWPIEQIAQTVEPDDAQRAALDELKNAIAQALDILKASCPTDLPSTPTGRIEAMRARLDGMLQAVRTIRPAMEKFYAALNDEQKARLNALAPAEDNPDQVRQNLTQVCNERAAGIASLPIKRIEQTVRPNEAQRGTLQALEDAASQAANLLKSDCPTYRALTAVGRLEAMEQRLDAMLRAVKTVQAALEEFYASLSNEQKERFNRLGPAQG